MLQVKAVLPTQNLLEVRALDGNSPIEVQCVISPLDGCVSGQQFDWLRTFTVEMIALFAAKPGLSPSQLDSL